MASGRFGDGVDVLSRAMQALTLPLAVNKEA